MDNPTYQDECGASRQTPPPRGQWPGPDSGTAMAQAASGQLSPAQAYMGQPPQAQAGPPPQAPQGSSGQPGFAPSSMAMEEHDHDKKKDKAPSQPGQDEQARYAWQSPPPHAQSGQRPAADDRDRPAEGQYMWQSPPPHAGPQVAPHSAPGPQPYTAPPRQAPAHPAEGQYMWQSPPPFAGPRTAPQYAPGIQGPYMAPPRQVPARPAEGSYMWQSPPSFAGPQYSPQGPFMAPGPQYGPPSFAAPGPQYGPPPFAAPTGAPHGAPDHDHGHEGCSCGKKGGHDAGGPPAPEGFDPKHLERRYGQLIELCGDLMRGKADPSKIMSFLGASGDHFWKGAIVGAGLTFLLTNDTVKSAVTDSLGSLFGGSKSGPAA